MVVLWTTIEWEKTRVSSSSSSSPSESESESENPNDRIEANLRRRAWAMTSVCVMGSESARARDDVGVPPGERLPETDLSDLALLDSSDLI